MKMKRLFATAVAAVVALGAMSFAAFAEDIDYTSIMEEKKANTLAGSAGWAGGQWLIGSDSKMMDDALTVADLEAADHFEIKYTAMTPPPAAEEGAEGAKLTFCYKFATAIDDTQDPVLLTKAEAYLPEGWVQYGPKEETGNTYHSMDYFTYDVKEEGTIIVPTKDIIASLVDKDSVLFLWQFGIGNNAYDFDQEYADECDYGADYDVTVTSVKLCMEPDEASLAAEEAVAEVTEPAETETPETEAPVEETTTAETTTEEITTTAAATTAAATTTAAAATADTAAKDSSFPIWGFVAIGAGALLIIVVIVIIVAKSKKK